MNRFSFYRWLAAVFCLCILFSFAGCTPDVPDPGSDSEGSVATGTDTDTDTGIISSSDLEEDKGPVGLPENGTEHLLMVTDIKKGRILVLDLNAEYPLDPDALVWEWAASTARGWKYPELCRVGLDDAKLRWSEYYQKYVVIITSSSGWAGIADYETRECLWETKVSSGPHSIEMLPNGDIVVACSGDTGHLRYYSITEGRNWKMVQDVELASAHGVLWDPQQQVLWALGHSRLNAYTVAENGDVRLTQVEGKGASLSSYGANGHDLSADYADSDRLWISTGDRIVQFSKSQNRILSEFEDSVLLYSQTNVKGISNFPDGTKVYCRGTGVQYDWATDTFHVVAKVENGRMKRFPFRFTNRTVYKVRSFLAEYQ